MRADVGLVVTVYGVLFMDWGKEFKSRSDKEVQQPFQGVSLPVICLLVVGADSFQIRDWYRRTMDSIWTSSSSQRGPSAPDSK